MAERARSKSKQPGQGAAGGEEDEGDEDDASVPKPPPKKRKAPKTYIPQQGSGPHGILIGLLLAVKEPEATIQVFLTKGELIRAAQPYCSSSYDRSERGTFVTAWNGMKTLVNKGYVVVQGSPHRYCLTEDG
jgi:crossover junction endonuclease MUS81